MADTTRLEHLIDPEVMTDMISAKIEKRISVLPYAKLDTKLQGRAGSTITVLQFTWDGEAVEVAEGEEIPLRNLGTKTAEYTIKKAGIGGEITDEAIECGLGDAVGALTDGIANSILAKLDGDSANELMSANTVYNASSGIGYDAIVEGIGLFDEEENGEKAMLLPPALITTLRKDDDFIDRSKYGNQVMIDGEIGMIGNARIKASRRIEGIGGSYYSPIIKLSADENDVIPALTYYLKRAANIETERKARSRKTEITGDQMYVVSLTNASKVVLVKTPGAPIKVKKIYEDTYTYPGTTVTFASENLSATTVTGSIASTTGTYTINFVGEAKKISATAISELGFTGTPTHYLIASIEIPGQSISDTAPTVTWGGTAVPAAEMRKIGSTWYIDNVSAVKLSGSDVVLASGQTTLPAIVCNGITTTFTPNFSKVTLEA